MKKLMLITAILVSIIALSGCLSALHPLFTVKDIVFDARLAGTWKTGNEDDDITIFEKGSATAFKELPPELQAVADKAYLLTIRNKDASEEFRYYAFLARIGNGLYLDYFPAENRRQQGYNDFYKQHMIGLHSFYRVKFLDDQSFEIEQFDENFLRDLIEKNKIRIKHEVRFDGRLIITASTEDLQKYVLKYGDVPEAYYRESNETYHKVQ